MKTWINAFYSVSMMLLLLCVISCDEKPWPGEGQAASGVVTKNIKTPSPAVTGPQPENGPPETTGVTTSTVPTEKVPPGTSDTSGEFSGPLPASASQKGSPGQVTSGPSGDNAVPENQTAVKREKLLAKTADEMVKNAYQIKTYDSKNRVDPFIPLLTEKKETEPSVDGEPEKREPKRILTPLETMDLSQIKLVAVLQMENGRSLAMVEEAGGKGYEVRIGTYMGKNGGRVSAINTDGVVIKEHFRDFKGKRRERLRELKFHHSEGGQ